MTEPKPPDPIADPPPVRAVVPRLLAALFALAAGIAALVLAIDLLRGVLA
jgi:hypothetical protein